MSTIQRSKKIRAAYRQGWMARLAKVEYGVDSFNPWPKPCPEGWAYMAGETDCPSLGWDKSLGGAEPTGEGM